MVSSDGTSGGRLMIWKVADKSVLTRRDQLPWIPSYMVSSPDGQQLAISGLMDGIVHLWDARLASEQHRLTGTRNEFSSELVYSTDGGLLGGAARDPTVSVWDTKHGQDAVTLGGATAVGSRVSLISGEGIRSGNLELGRDNQALGHCLGNRDRHVHSSPECPVGRRSGHADGRFVAGAAQSNEVLVFDTTTAALHATFSAPTADFTRLAFALDNRTLRLPRKGRLDPNVGRYREVRPAGASGWRTTVPRSHSAQMVHVWPRDKTLPAVIRSPKVSRRWRFSSGMSSRGSCCASFAGTSVRFEAWRIVAMGTCSRRGQRMRPSGSGTLTTGAIQTLNGTPWSSKRRFQPGRPPAGFGGRCTRLSHTPAGAQALGRQHGDGDAEHGRPHHGRLCRCLSTRWRAARLGDADGTIKLWDATPLTSEQTMLRAAPNLVESLFDQKLPIDEILSRIRQDSTISAQVSANLRRTWPKLRPGHLERSSRTSGCLTLRPTLAQGGCGGEVCAMSLSEPLRKQTLALAERSSDDPNRLNNASWNVVRWTGGEVAAYSRALRVAEVACRLSPDNSLLLNTLGVAQYRAGKYVDAAATLSLGPTKRNSRAPGGPLPADLAFLAMSQYRLCQTERARDTMKKIARGDEQNRPENGLGVAVVLVRARGS